MQQSSPSYRDSYQAATVADAARILGVSESTIRRQVRLGKLEAERVERPQGHAWLVKVPAPATDQPGSGHHLGATTPTNQPGPDALLAAWSAAVLAPIMAEMAAVRQAGERKDDIIREQAETIGTLRAELAAARAPERPRGANPGVSGQKPPTEPSTPDEPVSAPWRRRWLAAVYG